MVWIIEGARDYTEGNPLAYSQTKSNAEKCLRKAGYKFNSEFGLFLNSELGRWARIVTLELADDVFAPEQDGGK